MKKFVSAKLVKMKELPGETEVWVSLEHVMCARFGYQLVHEDRGLIRHPDASRTLLNVFPELELHLELPFAEFLRLVGAEATVATDEALAETMEQFGVKACPNCGLVHVGMCAPKERKP